MVKTFVNGQQIDLKGNVRSQHEAYQDLQKLYALEEENKWLIAIINKLIVEAPNSVLVKNLVLPEHIKKKLSLLKDTEEKHVETIDKTENNKSNIRK